MHFGLENPSRGSQVHVYRMVYYYKTLLLLRTLLLAMSCVTINTTANGTTIEKTSSATINISHIQVTPMFHDMVHIVLLSPQHR